MAFEFSPPAAETGPGQREKGAGVVFAKAVTSMTGYNRRPVAHWVVRGCQIRRNATSHGTSA